jgi:hypothetical protein
MNASERIDKVIADLGDWRGKLLADIRAVVHDADPEVVEEWKWMGTSTWSHDGILCLANAHTNWVNVIFPNGVKLADPEKLFNAFLEGNAWRAIKLCEKDTVNKPALKNLLRASLAFNRSKAKDKAKPLARAKAKSPKRHVG